MRFEEVDRTHAAGLARFTADLSAHDPDSYARCFPRGWTIESFAGALREYEAERLDWRPKARQTSRTRYVSSIGDDVVGFAVLMFPLGEQVPDNFWFVVAPSRRGRGYGTATLNRLLFEGARAGLARAAVSCPIDDAAARACIVKNRGEYRGDVGNRASFWLPLR